MGIDLRVAVLAVASVAVAVVLGFEAGLSAGPTAGVLVALAGLVPVVVWELTRDRRERNARMAEQRVAALTVLDVVPGPGGAIAEGLAGERGAAWYLRPEAQVVRFWPRPELGVLREWCTGGGRLGVRLVTGEGGSGKTRLALQLAEEVTGDGWRVLWVERGQEGAAVSTVRAAGEPAVLVVDYAETRAGLAGLLADAEKATRDEDCPELRVVLLARSAGEWWRQLVAWADYGLGQVLEGVAPLVLGPVRAIGGPGGCSMTQ